MDDGTGRSEAHLVRRLKQVAEERRRDALSDADRRSASLLDWAASDAGRATRQFIADMAKRRGSTQASAKRLATPPSEDCEPAAAVLTRRRRNSRDVGVVDDFGKPVRLDEAELIVLLVDWAASRGAAAPWYRVGAKARRAHLAKVVRHAKLLADLLTHPDGPEWPNAYDLFDDDARPQPPEPIVFSQELVVGVYARLKRQQLAPLLKNLVVEALRIERHTSRSVAETPRTNMGAFFQRSLAKDLALWFRIQLRLRPSAEMHSVIADILSALMPGLTIDTAQVKEWLRPPGRRAKKS